MITGIVADNSDLVIDVEVANSAGEYETLEFVLDTGFNGDLSMPDEVILRLGLEYTGPVKVSYAVGSGERQAYQGTVLWHGRPQEVEVINSDGEFLLGMEMLMGSRLTVDVRIGGEVLIEESSPTQ